MSKNNFKRITFGIRPIWGIKSLTSYSLGEGEDEGKTNIFATREDSMSLSVRNECKFESKSSLYFLCNNYWVWFCDIQNNQRLDKCCLRFPSASTDNTSSVLFWISQKTSPTINKLLFVESNYQREATIH